MPSRYYRRVFIKGYFYHIYNRGANKENIFWDDEDYETFVQILAYYLRFPSGKPLSILSRIERKIDQNRANKVPNLPNLETMPNIKSSVKLCAYCLMPNHFHLLIKQQENPLKENSVTNLMRRTIITYAMFSKKKYDHSGSLFQGKFKNVLVSSDTQLQQLSKYIHRNPLEIQGSEPLLKYRYSSYQYFNQISGRPDWLDVNEVLAFFPKNKKEVEYKKFIEETPTIETIKDLTLE